MQNFNLNAEDVRIFNSNWSRQHIRQSQTQLHSIFLVSKNLKLEGFVAILLWSMKVSVQQDLMSEIQCLNSRVWSSKFNTVIIISLQYFYAIVKACIQNWCVEIPVEFNFAVEAWIQALANRGVQDFSRYIMEVLNSQFNARIQT